MEFLFIYTIAIILASGFVTWIFTYRHAERKGNSRGFDAGYELGLADAFNSVENGKRIVERARNNQYGALTADVFGTGEASPT